METLERVKTGNQTRVQQNGLEELYESAFPAVAGFVQKMGGDFDSAKDIFHDALVIYYEVAQNKTLLNPGAYILGIAKHLWVRKFRGFTENVPLSHAELHISIPEDFYAAPKTQKLVTFLERAGKRCMDLLRAFYYQEQHIKKLAKQLGYANEHSASAQKYKCLEKVREMVKQKHLAYEDFVE